MFDCASREPERMPGEDDGQPAAVPKLCGFDVELGNSVMGADLPGGSGGEAASALLREFEGLSPEAHRWSSGSRSYGGYSYPAYGGWDGYGSCGANGWSPGRAPGSSRDWGRKWLPSMGTSVYIDLCHLEITCPELLSARDHVAVFHAMLRKVRRARDAANSGLPEGQRIEVLVNSSDGHGNAYGPHISVLVATKCYEEILRKPTMMSVFASHLASSILYGGQGKVGSENGRPDVEYQLGQRPDFVEQLIGPQTTCRRPLINTRRESLAGRSSGLERLHVIGPHDATLCHGSIYLKVGALQLVLACLEQGFVDTALTLDDPVEATVRWSHGGCNAPARRDAGGEITALEMQEAILAHAAEFVREGRAEGIVPDAEDILAYWKETLALVRQNDIHLLARRCDWALKLVALDRAMTRHGLDWRSEETRMLSGLYSSVAADEGLYFQYEAAGRTDLLVSDEDIERAGREPPADTRAWLRAELLRRAPEGCVDAVDWEYMRFRLAPLSGYGTGGDYMTIHMDCPLDFTRAKLAGVVEQAGSFEALLEALGAGRTRNAWDSGAASSPVQVTYLLPAGSPEDRSGGEGLLPGGDEAATREREV